MAHNTYQGLRWDALAAICRKRDLPTNSGDRKSSWLDLKQRLVNNDERQERVGSVTSINRVTELEAEVARLRAQVAELETDVHILACAELISYRQYGLAEEIGPQPTQKQINEAVRRAQKRAADAKRGV